MPQLTTPNMPSLPSMPAIQERLAALKTPGKMLSNIGRPTMPNIDFQKSVESVKGYMPSMPKGF